MKTEKEIEVIFFYDCEQHLLCYNNLENIDFTTLGERIHKALKRLTAREREVICRRFGLYHFEPETLQQIGKTMQNSISGKIGVSPETIRAIEGKALRKLRHPSYSCFLK